MAGKENVKGTFGNEPIELNNAATETTLTAMLKLAQKDSAVLAEMAKKAGVNEKNIKDALDKSNQGGGSVLAGGAGLGLTAIGGAAKVAGGLLGDMAGMVMSAASSLGNFVGALANGTTKASELALAFKDLPLGLGTFAQLLSFANKVMEENMDTYRAMSQSGSGIVGSINSLKVSATRLGLTTSEYAQMFVSSGDALVRLGGSMSKGSENLVRMNNLFISTNMGRNLLGLGYSYAQLNEMLPNYIKASGDSLDTTKDFREEMNRLQKASAHYGADLDYVARATGQNREELMRKKQEIMQEASFQMFMMKQPKEMQAVYNDIITRQMVTGGKGLVDLTKARMMGFAGGFSKEAQAYAALFGESSELIEEQISLGGKKLNEDQRREALDKIQVKQIRNMIAGIDGMDTTIMALGQQMGLSGKGMEEFVTLTNKWRTKEGGFAKTETEMMNELKEVWENAKTDAAASQAQIDLEAKARKASADIQKALNPLLIKLRDITIDMIGKFTKIISENMPAIENAMNRFIEFVEKVFKNPDAAIAQVKGYLQELMAWFFDGLSTGPIGKFLFGDQAESMRQRAQLNAALAIDAERYAELKKQNGEGTLKGRDAEEYARMQETYRKAAGVVAYQMRTKEYDVDAAREEANRRLKAAGKNPNDKSEVWDQGMGMHLTNYQLELRRIYEKFQADKAQRDQEANKIMGGGYQYEKVPEMIKKLDQSLYNLPARAGGSPDGKAEDWGRESLVKLHGKEAVLTEEQLVSMNKSKGGSTTIELADLKIVAEGIITLNRQAALQNRILGQMIDNQKTMIQRSSGNRLMV